MFTQADTFHGDVLNLYVYTWNNPVRYVDPSGHCCKECGIVESGSGTTLFLPDEYYQKLDDNIAKSIAA